MRNTTAKRDIVILAPRHGAGALPSPAVLKKARLLAKKKGKRLVIPSPTTPSKNGEDSSLDAEIESSSDWNSMLLTARAQRGPQWDVASQQFMVDHGSELFYNFTALMEVHKEKDDGVRQEQQQRLQQQQQQQHQQQQIQQQQQHQQQLQLQHQQQQQQQHHHQQSGMHVQSHHAQQMQHQQQQSIHLSEAGSYRELPPAQQYGSNPYQNGGMVQLQQAPQHGHSANPGAMTMGGAGSGFGPDVYIPPDIQRNPRRTTRGANGQREGMYRV